MHYVAAMRSPRTRRLWSVVVVSMLTAAMASLAGISGGSGAAVSGKPVITGGWRCTGNTLVTTPPAGSPVSGTWTLTRTGKG